MIDRSQVPRRRLDARPDVLDLRDRWYASALASVPQRRSLAEYQRQRTLVLDQGVEGACAAFAVATVANFLMRAGRDDAAEPASPWMLHEMARRTLEPSDDDAPSISLRCALKGWQRHGVCGRSLWPEQIADSEPALTAQRSADAAARPLAAYFRIDHRDFSSVHAALTEAGILLASAWIYDGWLNPDADGVIRDGSRRLGCHAFAIVAYDQDGLWIQNSWGRHWGLHGFGYLDYDQWLRYGADVWAVQLGSQVRVHPHEIREPGPAYAADAAVDLRPHVVSLDRDGRLRTGGRFGNTKADVEAIFRNDIPRITAGWERPRILLHAGGGLHADESELKQIRKRVPRYLRRQIYPIALLWRSGIRASLDSLLRIALAEPELARSPQREWRSAPPREEALEALVRRTFGRTFWEEIRRGALQSCVRPSGGARLLAGLLAHWMVIHPACELHISAHGAGAIAIAPLLALLATKGRMKAPGFSGTPGFGLRVATCTLSAPACTPELFQATYGAAIGSDAIARTTLVVLDEASEAQDAWSDLYQRSFLRMVANALEERPGAMLVGDAATAKSDPTLRALIRSRKLELLVAPGQGGRARTHEELERDDLALQATIARIIGVDRKAAEPRARAR